MNQITNSFTLQLSPGSECFTEKYYLNVIDRIEEEDYEENQYFVKMQSLFVKCEAFKILMFTIGF